MQNGTDMHSYELTFGDMTKISNADVFIYVGGESDESWVNKAISNATNKNMACINLVEILGEKALIEEEKEGMREEHSHHEEEVDEHVWLSIKNASFYVNYLANKLGKIDAGNKQTFIDNANAYLSSLNRILSQTVFISSDKQSLKLTESVTVLTSKL
jgi:zinc transport system substrate-binding protein